MDPGKARDLRVVLETCKLLLFVLITILGSDLLSFVISASHISLSFVMSVILRIAWGKYVAQIEMNGRWKERKRKEREDRERWKKGKKAIVESENHRGPPPLYSAYYRLTLLNRW